MDALLEGLTVENYRPHPLHAPERIWAETNCNLDLWIELLNALGLQPEAALAATVRQDFEGDHFTFTKVPLWDLEVLYGLEVKELPVHQPIDRHIVRQMARNHMCMVEVDPYFLPDTGIAAYRTQHGKTTIGINKISVADRSLEYFHNAGYYRLSGDDYRDLFGAAMPADLPFRPYTEFLMLEPVQLSQAELMRQAADLLDRHWAKRPRSNPIRRFQAVFAERAEALAGQPQQAFHDFAFHNLRLLGSNFELLASFLDWLSDPGADFCRTIAEAAKTAQFQTARAVARRQFQALAPSLDAAADAWDMLFKEPVVVRKTASVGAWH